MNMQQMMRQAQQMQRQLAEAQDHLSEIEVSASTGGGMVKISGTADMTITSVKIDGSQLGLDEEDTEMLQDSILAAVNEVINSAQQIANDQVSAVTGGMGLPGMF